jgi:hypothetical protein
MCRSSGPQTRQAHAVPRHCAPRCAACAYDSSEVNTGRRRLLDRRNHGCIPSAGERQMPAGEPASIISAQPPPRPEAATDRDTGRKLPGDSLATDNWRILIAQVQQYVKPLLGAGGRVSDLRRSQNVLLWRAASEGSPRLRRTDAGVKDTPSIRTVTKATRVMGPSLGGHQGVKNRTRSPSLRRLLGACRRFSGMLRPAGAGFHLARLRPPCAFGALEDILWLRTGYADDGLARHGGPHERRGSRHRPHRSTGSPGVEEARLET